MPITVEAVVENGLLRPLQPLPLMENAQVRITIQPKENWVQESYGLCGWKGNAEGLRRLALAADLDVEQGS
jgi:predicted DNA-binding antitoxin AbrB/MazE fold protein